LRAVLPPDPGGDSAPRLGELPEPIPAAGEALMQVSATALNRVDLMQLRGLYPPPVGASEIPGLEAAGVIVGLGAGVEGWRLGERAAALLAGGGHAERVAAPVGQLIRVPESWSWAEAAALPEAAITGWTNLVAEGGLRPGQTVLVSGATSGVGSYTAGLAKALGASVIAVARDRERLDRLPAPRPDRRLTFDEMSAAGPGLDVDLVVDFVGGGELPRLLSALRPRGRLVLVGLMAGRTATLDLGDLLRRRLELRGSVLRSRPAVEKSDLVAGFTAFAAERLARRELVPLVERVFDFERIADAYAHLERGRPFGKVVVRFG